MADSTGNPAYDARIEKINASIPLVKTLRKHIQNIAEEIEGVEYPGAVYYLPGVVPQHEAQASLVQARLWLGEVLGAYRDELTELGADPDGHPYPDSMDPSNNKIAPRDL